MKNELNPWDFKRAIEVIREDELLELIIDKDNVSYTVERGDKYSHYHIRIEYTNYRLSFDNENGKQIKV